MTRRMQLVAGGHFEGVEFCVYRGAPLYRQQTTILLQGCTLYLMMSNLY